MTIFWFIGVKCPQNHPNRSVLAKTLGSLFKTLGRIKVRCI